MYASPLGLAESLGTAHVQTTPPRYDRAQMTRSSLGMSDARREEFERAGAGGLVHRTLLSLHQTLELLEDDATLLTSTPVVDVLSALPYDAEDSVYVVWRADRVGSFWTQARRDRYLEHLRVVSARNGGYLNQTRVMVYDDAEPQNIATPRNIMPPDDIFFSLLPLHRSGTFLSLPRGALVDYPAAAKLSFGYTLSRSHGYAVIPVPFAEDLEPRELGTDRLGGYLANHRDYQEGDGPMRAVVTINESFISTLLAETQALLADARASVLNNDERVADIG